MQDWVFGLGAKVLLGNGISLLNLIDLRQETSVHKEIILITNTLDRVYRIMILENCSSKVVEIEVLCFIKND